MYGIEILAIGSELLRGKIANTNAAWISQELFRQGWRVSRHQVVPDEKAVVAATFTEALGRSRIVICTGGLGPTCDDLTRQIAADLFGLPLCFNKEIADELEQRFGQGLASLKDQATVPNGAVIIPNKVGTASGLILSTQDASSHLILLPGVPAEMRPMLLDHVIPFLGTLFTGMPRTYSRSIYLAGLSESAVDPTLRRICTRSPEVEAGIYPSHGVLTVQFSVVAASAQEAHSLLQTPCQEVLTEFPTHAFEAAGGTLEEAVHHQFITGGKTLAVAESCTGGALSARLTRLPGASAYFLGGAVVYSNELKEKLLGVDTQTLAQHGAVSREVALEMVSGLLAATGADVGAAVTGIAGPDGGSLEKPVGTVWLAVGGRGATATAWRILGKGSRETIITRSVNEVLAHLLTKIN